MSGIRLGLSLWHINRDPNASPGGKLRAGDGRYSAVRPHAGVGGAGSGDFATNTDPVGPRLWHFDGRREILEFGDPVGGKLISGNLVNLDSRLRGNDNALVYASKKSQTPLQ